jgi:hypothetical protein
MRRSWLFLVCCVAGIALIVAYVAATRRHSAIDPAGSGNDIQLISTVPDGPVMLFRNASPGDVYGRVGVARLPLPPAGDTPRMIAAISCDRVHYASGRGVCMVADEARLPVRYYAYVFDRSFREQHRVALTGPPIRARVAPGGRRAALTVFEKGHSYADQAFSTRTIVIDTATGRTIADLEDLSVTRDGRPFKAVDFNFWGVTFASDGDGFYATLKTGNARYLVKGSIDARRVEVMRDDVECPSLSPDGRLIVFKKPLDRGVGWRLTALDLAAGAERPLKQSQRSVDDQVDWFDPGHVVYHDSSPEGMGVWVLSTDGVTSPRLLLKDASSPAVER